MRMRDLARRSGLPRTTVHHYLREGLLPPAAKTARNAARYSEEHLRRLRLIHRLRSGDLGPLPIRAVRRILRSVDDGVEPELAVLLQRSVLAGTAPRVEGRTFSARALAARCGLPEGAIGELVKAGLLVPPPSGGPGTPRFDGTDLEVAARYRQALEATGLRIRDVAPLARLIREVSRREMALRNRAVARAGPAEGARISLLMQETANLMHRYLFARAREQEIGRLAAGAAAEGRARPGRRPGRQAR